MGDLGQGSGHAAPRRWRPKGDIAKVDKRQGMHVGSLAQNASGGPIRERRRMPQGLALYQSWSGSAFGGLYVELKIGAGNVLFGLSVTRLRRPSNVTEK